MNEQENKPALDPLFVPQMGGEHYQADLQHWDFIEMNGLPYTLGCATKYLRRWREKDGVKDLQKSLSYLDKMLALNKAGFLKPKPHGLRVPLADFLAANRLGAVEAAATTLIVNWRKPGDLEMAKAMIQTLIDAG